MTTCTDITVLVKVPRAAVSFRGGLLPLTPAPSLPSTDAQTVYGTSDTAASHQKGKSEVIIMLDWPPPSCHNSLTALTAEVFVCIAKHMPSHAIDTHITDTLCGAHLQILTSEAGVIFLL